MSDLTSLIAAPAIDVFNVQNRLAESEHIVVFHAGSSAVRLGDTFLIDGELDHVIDLWGENFLRVLETCGHAQTSSIARQASEVAYGISWSEAEATATIGITIYAQN
jgi:hypothetical protein